MWESSVGKAGDVEMADHINRGYSDSSGIGTHQFNGAHGAENGGDRGASAHDVHNYMLAQNKFDEAHELPGAQRRVAACSLLAAREQSECWCGLLSKHALHEAAPLVGGSLSISDIRRRLPVTWPFQQAHYTQSQRCRNTCVGTAERTGKWHMAAVHNVTAIVGAGVLGLPYAMAYLTWSGGVIVLLLSWTTSLYTLWQVHSPNRPEFTLSVIGQKLGVGDQRC